MNRALIIDGSAIMYRSFYATQRNKDEEQQSKDFYLTLEAINKTIKRFSDRHNYKYALVSFDSCRVTFRNEIFPEYKTHRESMPRILRQNIPLIQQEFRLLGFVVVDAPLGFEGDDVIATTSKLFSDNKIPVDIVSIDRDLLQLVSPFVNLILLRPKGKIEVHNINNFSGLNNSLQPHQIPYLKALSGDSSDNYKGVKGIGPKGAIDLLIKYKDIFLIYENISELSPKLQQTLLEHKETIFLFLELALLKNDLNISRNLSDYESSQWIREPRRNI